MGQRRLEIIPNKNGKVLPDDHIHQGTFEPGIAEALRYIEDLNGLLANVRDVVILLTKGDSTHQSAQEIYENVLGTVEGLLENANKTVDKLNPAVRKLISQMNEAGNSVSEVVTQVDTTVKVTTDAVNGKIKQAEDAIAAIAEGTRKAEKIIADIENSDTMDKFVNSREFVDQVTDLIKKTSLVLAAIDTKGIKVYDENGKQVKLFTWKNTNLIGKTAREKARIRAEKGESLPNSEPEPVSEPATEPTTETVSEQAEGE